MTRNNVLINAPSRMIMGGNFHKVLLLVSLAVSVSLFQVGIPCLAQAQDIDQGKIDQLIGDVQSDKYKALYNPVTKIAVNAVYRVGKPASVAVDKVGDVAVSAVLGAKTGAATGTPHGAMAGAIISVAKDIGKDAAMLLLRDYLENPQAVARGLANEAIKSGLKAYSENYALVKKMQDGGQLTADEKERFAENHVKVSMLGPARKMYNQARSDYSSPLDENTVMQTVKIVESSLTESSLASDVLLAGKIVDAIEDSKLPVEAYAPYRDFVNASDRASRSVGVASPMAATGNVFPESERASDHSPSNDLSISVRPNGGTSQDGPSRKMEYRLAEVKEARKVVSDYGSIPGGITLEGVGVGLPDIDSIRYSEDANIIVLNDQYVYFVPVPSDEFRIMLSSIKKTDSMGISLHGGVTTVYGNLNIESDVAQNLVIADNFLGHILYGYRGIEWLQGYKLPDGFVPEAQDRNAVFSGVTFKFNKFGFSNVENIISVEQGVLTTLVIPLSKKETDFGGYLPDEAEMKNGTIQPALEHNLRHLSNNITYYNRERFMRICYRYGEVAAFLRHIKASNPTALDRL